MESVAVQVYFTAVSVNPVWMKRALGAAFTLCISHADFSR
jgi:hypothetical protein